MFAWFCGLLVLRWRMFVCFICYVFSVYLRCLNGVCVLFGACFACRFYKIFRIYCLVDWFVCVGWKFVVLRVVLGWVLWYVCVLFGLFGFRLRWCWVFSSFVLLGWLFLLCFLVFVLVLVYLADYLILRLFLVCCGGVWVIACWWCCVVFCWVLFALIVLWFWLLVI